jgi:hypothetical protein
LEVARRLPDPARPQLTALFQPEEIENAPFTPLKDARELEPLLRDGKLPYPRALVVVTGDLSWDEVLRFVKPLLTQVTQLDLAMSEPNSG